MAYVPVEEEDEEQGQGGSEQVLSSPGSQVGAGGGSSGYSSGASPKPTNSGTGWTNLTQYVSANEGQDARMGGAVKDAYKGQEGAAKGVVDTYGSTAEKTIKDNTVTDSGVVGTLQGIKPGTLAPTPDLSANFAKQAKGWQGPQDVASIEGFGTAERGVQDISGEHGAAARANDFEGRRSYLTDIYQDPRYKAGEQRLDSFLVGAGDAGRQSLNEIQDSATAFKGGWENLVNLTDQNLGTARATTDQTRDATLGAYGGAVDRMSQGFKSVQGEAATKSAANTQKYSAVETALTSGDPQQAAWAFGQLGVNPEEGQYLLSLGVPPKAIMSRAGDQNFGDLVSEGDVGNWQALESLASAGQLGPLEKYDFSKSGNTGSNPWNVRQDMVGKAGEGKALQTALEKRLADSQLARKREMESVIGMLNSFSPEDRQRAAAQLGMDSTSLIDEAESLGVDVSGFFRKGTDLNLGDIATDQERQSWTNLMSYLGTGSPINLMDSQDEGAAFGFDTQGLITARDQAIAARNARNAQNAVPEAPPAAAPAPSGKGPQSAPDHYTEKAKEQAERDAEKAKEIGGGLAEGGKKAKKKLGL